MKRKLDTTTIKNSSTADKKPKKRRISKRKTIFDLCPDVYKIIIDFLPRPQVNNKEISPSQDLNNIYFFFALIEKSPYTKLSAKQKHSVRQYIEKSIIAPLTIKDVAQHLYYLVTSDNKTKLESLLKTEIATSSYHDKNTLLHIGAQNRNGKALDCLLGPCSKILQDKNNKGLTALDVAVIHKRLIPVKRLLSAGLVASDTTMCIAINNALSSPDGKVALMMLIKSEAQINDKPMLGALNNAYDSKNGKAILKKLLLSQNKTLNDYPHVIFSLLVQKRDNITYNQVKTVLSFGFDPNTPLYDENKNYTYLLHAMTAIIIEHGKPEMKTLKLILDYGAHLDLKNYYYDSFREKKRYCSVFDITKSFIDSYSRQEKRSRAHNVKRVLETLVVNKKKPLIKRKSKNFCSIM